MTNPRFFVSPQPGDHVWVFSKGPLGYARWMVPVKVWEISDDGRALPVTVVDLHPGYDYAVPSGDYYCYNSTLYDGIGDAFQQWCKEQSERAK